MGTLCGQTFRCWEIFLLEEEKFRINKKVTRGKLTMEVGKNS